MNRSNAFIVAAILLAAAVGVLSWWAERQAKAAPPAPTASPPSPASSDPSSQ